ncbi:MAG TPA: hypothetical protein VF803_00250 [Candidatus Paceibacterota bacterium]
MDRQIFDLVPAPERLYRSIVARVEYLEWHRAALRAGALSLTAVISALGVWKTALYAWNEASLSGFVEYIKLIATDGDVALNYWHTLAYSLLESMPMLPTALMCATLLVFVWSASYAIGNMRIAMHGVHAA